MLTSPNQKLLEDIEKFLAETGMGPKYFGKKAAKNSEVISRLQDGGRVWPETEMAIRVFMATYSGRKSAKPKQPEKAA